MKKKIIFGMAICLFAMATMFSFNKSQQGSISYISLKNIEVMSQAYAGDEITSKNYYAKYYIGSGSWCCYSGNTGCISSNCP
jgi:hypothetical protein